MKKIIILCIILVLIFLSLVNKETSEVQVLVGIIFIEEDVLNFDEVEIITRDDKDRINELNLREKDDLPNGYYVHNPEINSESYKLMQDTKYIFTDFELRFVKETEGNRIYETTEREEFLDGSSYQHNSLGDQKIPYFIEVQKDQVIGINEVFIFTQ